MQGFRATNVLRSYYEGTDKDAYEMRYRLPNIDATSDQFHPRNRISRYYAA